MPVPQDLEMHTAYAVQQWLDGYAQAVKHAIEHKTRFDKKVLGPREGEVTFKKGCLVQVY